MIGHVIRLNQNGKDLATEYPHKIIYTNQSIVEIENNNYTQPIKVAHSTNFLYTIMRCAKNKVIPNDGCNSPSPTGQHL